MLTVAPISWPEITTPAAWNAARTRSATSAASAALPGMIAANSSPPSRPITSVGAHVGGRGRGEHLERVVADGMAEAVVDRFELVEIEHQHADRLRLARALRDQRVGRFEKGAPVEQAGEQIGHRRGLVHQRDALLRHDHDDEGGADHIDHGLEARTARTSRRRTTRRPATAGINATAPETPRCAAAERRSDSQRATSVAPAFAPQLERGAERHRRAITTDDSTTRACSDCANVRELHGHEPDHRAGEQRARQHRAAVKQPRAAPDHAAGDEQQRIRHFRRDEAAQRVPCAPQKRHRERAHQIGRRPTRPARACCAPAARAPAGTCRASR